MIIVRLAAIRLSENRPLALLRALGGTPYRIDKVCIESLLGSIKCNTSSPDPPAFSEGAATAVLSEYAGRPSSAGGLAAHASPSGGE